MTKAVFFDMGGVLLKEGLADSIREYGKKHNIPEGKFYSSAHDRPYWREFTLGNITEVAYIKQVSADLGEEDHLDDWRQLIRQSFASHTDVLEFIKLLKGKYILGVISNNPKEWFDYLWNINNLDELFTIKAVASYIHIRKPDQRIFQYALDQAGVTGREAIYVDNRPERVDGATSLGIEVVVFQNLDHLKTVLSI